MSPEVLAERVAGFEALVANQFASQGREIAEVKQTLGKIGWGVVGAVGGIGLQLAWAVVQVVFHVTIPH